MSTAVNSPASAHNVWLSRLRILLATLVLWGALHYLAGGWLLPRGLERPPVLVASPVAGPLAGMIVVLVIWAASAVAALILGPREQRLVLPVLGLGLALWAAEGGRSGGTMDTWLILQQPKPGPPTSSPYWILLGDYALLAAAVIGARALAALIVPTDHQQPDRQTGLRVSFGLEAPPDERKRGLLALVVTVVVATIATHILMGSAVAETLRGQVYFAVAVAFLLGTWVARQVAHTENPAWFWPAPLIVGVIGLIVAGLKPDMMLPDAYRKLNTIPAWGAARALPIEMVGVGLAGTLLMLRPRRGPTVEQAS